MHHGGVESIMLIGLKPRLENQGRLLDPGQPSGGGACPDLATFDLAIDSELRGCDVVRLKGMTVDRAMVRERKPDFPSHRNLASSDYALSNCRGS